MTQSGMRLWLVLTGALLMGGCAQLSVNPAFWQAREATVADTAIGLVVTNEPNPQALTAQAEELRSVAVTHGLPEPATSNLTAVRTPFLSGLADRLRVHLRDTRLEAGKIAEYFHVGKFQLFGTPDSTEPAPVAAPLPPYTSGCAHSARSCRWVDAPPSELPLAQ